MAISAVVSEEFQEPLTYEQALASPEAELWKQAMDGKCKALEDNHTWQKIQHLMPKSWAVNGYTRLNAGWMVSHLGTKPDG